MSHSRCKFWLIPCKWQSPGSPNVDRDWSSTSCLERRSSTCFPSLPYLAGDTRTIPYPYHGTNHLTGTLLVLIQLQAVEMAAQCISWTLGPWSGSVICKWREYLVENIVHMLSIFKYHDCLMCPNINITQYLCIVSYTFSGQVFCILLLKRQSSLAMSVLSYLF